MNRRVFSIVAAFAFAAVSAATARAQSEQSTQPTQPPAPAQTKVQEQAATPSAPQKKVWTNDEMSSLDPHAGVSTVGKETRPASTHVATTNGHDAKWYQDQITKLQAKIPPLDSQIAELQAALEGNQLVMQKNQLGRLA